MLSQSKYSNEWSWHLPSFPWSNHCWTGGSPSLDHKKLRPEHNGRPDTMHQPLSQCFASTPYMCDWKGRKPAMNSYRKGPEPHHVYNRHLPSEAHESEKWWKISRRYGRVPYDFLVPGDREISIYIIEKDLASHRATLLNVTAMASDDLFKRSISVTSSVIFFANIVIFGKKTVRVPSAAKDNAIYIKYAHKTEFLMRAKQHADKSPTGRPHVIIAPLVVVIQK